MTDLETGSRYSVRTGIDIVDVEEFRQSLERGGDIMRTRLFSPAEADAKRSASRVILYRGAAGRFRCRV